MARPELLRAEEAAVSAADFESNLRKDPRVKALLRVLDRVACPDCHGPLTWDSRGLACVSCSASYPVNDGIVDLRPAAHAQHETFAEWSEHWQAEHQENFVIRLCSVYRTAIFSWSIGYFVNKYLAREGLLLEAGSGTSETSVRVDKHGDKRILMATDIIRGALERSHPVMSGRMLGDIFQLPYKDNSVDGIWNVGVMEHFSHGAIDQVMKEFHRVLKKGGRIVLLWPGRDSLPQKLLHLFTRIIRAVRRQKEFQLHPAEISQLTSIAQGKDFLARAGFRTIAADGGIRSLMACKTLVGEK